MTSISNFDYESSHRDGAAISTEHSLTLNAEKNIITKILWPLQIMNMMDKLQKNRTLT